jgi:hypothetical protein
MARSVAQNQSVEKGSLMGANWSGVICVVVLARVSDGALLSRFFRTATAEICFM